MSIENICVGGYGGTAHVYVQLRNVFPGPGGRVKTTQDFVVACRAPRSIEVDEIDDSHEDIELSDLTQMPTRNAFNIFLRHVLLQKFDDYFFRTGKYRFAHIPRVLGCNRRGVYFYEWVHGMEGFDPRYYDDYLKRFVPVIVDEWNICRSCFDEVGVDIFDDIVDTDGYFIKNVITQEPQANVAVPVHISRMWKRVGFDEKKTIINFSRLKDYIKTEKKCLEANLSEGRYETIQLAVKFLQNDISNAEFKRFRTLILDYRLSTLRHLNYNGFGAPPYDAEDIGVISK